MKMLASILFLMLGIRLEMGVSYYIVLAMYFGIWLLKFGWNLIKDDYIQEPKKQEQAKEE